MKIKLNLFSISYILFSLYILGILIPFNQNRITSKNPIKELKFSSYVKNIEYNIPSKRKKKDEDWDDDDWEWDESKYEEEMKNLSEQYNFLMEQKNDQKLEIRKSIFYLVFLGILAFILLLVIIIYCSIKCYILCSSPKSNTEYLISRLSLNHLGEVYIGENGELKYKKSINYNSAVNCDAPISANSDNERQYNTFNPDNFVSSEEDKKLYRPYNKEDIN